MPADPCCIMCCSTVDGTGVLNSCQHFLCSRCFGKFGTNPRLPPPNNNWCPRCKAGCKTIPLNAPTFPKHILDQISSDPAADLKATLAAVEFQSAADKAIVVRLKELVQALNTSNTNYRTKTATLEAKLTAAEKEAAELRQRCQQLEAAAAAGGGGAGFGGGAPQQQPYPHHQQHHPHHGSLPPPPPHPHQQQHSYGAPSVSMAPMSVPMASAGSCATPGMGSAAGGPNPLATPILMGYLGATPQAAGSSGGSSSYPQQHHNHPPQAMGGGAPLSSAQTSMAPHSSMQSVSMPPQGGPSSVSPAPNHHHPQPMGNGQLHHHHQQQQQYQQQHPYGNGISPGAAVPAAAATGGGLPSSASVSVSPAGWGGSAKKRERDGDANASAHQQPSTSPAMVSAAAVRCNGSALMELATIVQQQQQQEHQHQQQHANNGVVGGPHGGGVAMPPQTPAGQVYNLRALTERGGGGGARGTSADANIKINGGSNGGGVRGGSSANIAPVAPQAMGLDQGRLLHQLRASGNGSANRRGSGSAGGGVASGGPSSSSAQHHHHQQQAAYGGHRAPSSAHHPSGAAAAAVGSGGCIGNGGGGKLTIGNLAAHNVRLASVMR